MCARTCQKASRPKQRDHRKRGNDWRKDVAKRSIILGPGHRTWRKRTRRSRMTRRVRRLSGLRVRCQAVAHFHAAGARHGLDILEVLAEFSLQSSTLRNCVRVAAVIKTGTKRRVEIPRAKNPNSRKISGSRFQIPTANLLRRALLKFGSFFVGIYLESGIWILEYTGIASVR